jgi:Ca2+-binding EF-hand superfamily protein
MDEIKAISEMCKLQKILHKYDLDHSGKLERNELSQLLMDYDFSSKNPALPSEEELNLVMSLTHPKQASEGAIDLGHLKPALQEWTGYLKMREPLQTAFHEYDVSGTGKLEPPELKEYLKKMNGNKQVSDEEVDWVLSKADISGDGTCSSLSELYLATKSWSRRKQELSHSGQCCIVM